MGGVGPFLNSIILEIHIEDLWSSAWTHVIDENTSYYLARLGYMKIELSDIFNINIWSILKIGLKGK